WGDALVAAVRSGEVDEAVIDDHLGRLLLLAQRTGALGTPRVFPADLPAPSSSVRREQLTRIAARGMTVLQNNDSVLPLDRSTTVALIGRHAVETIDMGGGSAQVNPPYQVSVAEGLSELLVSRVTVVDGVDVRSRPVPAREGFFASLQAVLYDAAGNELERRPLVGARTIIGMDDDFSGKVATVRFTGVVSAPGSASSSTSGPASGSAPSSTSGSAPGPASRSVELGVIGVGDWQLSAGGHSSSVSLSVSGNGFGEEILAPPTHTFVVSVSPGDVFEATVSLGDSFGIGGFGLIGHAASRETVDVIDEAVRAAAAADVAVVVVGLTEEQETESVDKATLHLPGAQNALVEAVAGAARRTVVVVNAATPVIMPWLSRVDAVLWAGLPGQEGGHAVAAALLGEIEPAGRLVTTFPTDDGKTPAWSVTPIDGKLVYDEGRFVGYRGHFGGHAPDPVFWLGHGLGYTTWEYTDVRLVLGDAPAIHATVKNTGKRTSREVVQVYLRPVEPNEPIRLIGWTAITVEPGKSARVTVHTDRRMWRKWDTDSGSWTRIADGGTFLVARGLGDIRASVS
ncbi:MAG TPA: glycoside hydrolase family 3 C-terminal domain-containing protein, partial [Actinoplanes sp.]